VPTSKLTTATAVELIAPKVGLPAQQVRQVLDLFEYFATQAMIDGHEVELGDFGYLRLAEPKRVSPLRGEVTRGKRVAFREKDANRHRFK
jgi:hypothetical protein